jgi:hypothetical protein
MNEGFPPLELPDPERRERRRESPRRAPLPADVIARRDQIAQALHAKIQGLSQDLRSLNDNERRAVFYKLEHDIPFTKNTFSGTGLKPILQPSPDVTFAVPTDANLERLDEKIRRFAEDTVRGGHLTNEWLAFIRSIEEADPKERLSEDLRSSYEELVASEWVVCEIEFFSLKKGPQQLRREIAEWLADLRQTFANGVHGHLFEHEMALPTCRAVIRCKGSMFRALVEEPRWIERIRWIESRPQFRTFHEIWGTFRFEDLEPIPEPPADAPTVCIIDSGISAGNPFLTPVTRDELLRSYLQHAPDNPSDEFGHGSAVASLAAYYALNLEAGAVNTPRVIVAGARILNAQGQLEDERLFSSLLEDVVRDFSAMGIRIYCLSVCDSRRIWSNPSRKSFPRQSWVARKIDQLSRQYDVVFVTCTGNLDQAEIQDYLNDSNPYPEYLATESAKILDPGQASLAVTVGSIARGTLIVTSPATAIALENQPSPFTRSGPGIRKEIKPELVEYGGNMAFKESISRVVLNRGLQVVAASHQLTPAACLNQGTSFSAPRVAHKAAQILKDLETIGVPNPSASLIRAFLVNSAGRTDPLNRLPQVAAAMPEDDRQALHNILGYGIPDYVRATYCDEYSSICIYEGEINPDEVLFFDIPIPEELSTSRQEKILTVTVVHAPEVQRWGLERYHGIDLKWRMFRGDVDRDEIVSAMSQEVTQSDEERPEESEAEDEAAELPSEVRFDLGVTRRSRGTVQHDRHEWRQHQSEYSDNHYTLAVAAYKRWQRKAEPSPIAIVVRLEEQGRSVPVYALQQQAIAQMRATARG